jgi:HD-like signal output (HDOD) protein
MMSTAEEDTASISNSPLTPELVVSELHHLPSAPKVLPPLKRLLQDGNSSMDEIVSLIRLDPGIAARVLRVGNSAFYNRGGHRCITVEHAVNLVGYEQVYELVSYAVASQVLVQPLAIYGLEADETWKRAVTCAIAAEVLANETGEDKAIAYTIGLLHGIGMVAVDAWALRRGPALMLTWKPFPRECVDGERALLGFTHADVGAAMLRSWDFPISIWEPLRWQYAPRNSAGHPRMAALIYAAKWLRTVVCDEAMDNPPDATLLAPLRLTSSRLAAAAPVVRQRLNEVKSLLDLG